ncbi:MAG TPA: acetylglutamate kinase [Candidatus Omnitrophica bacterium]|nr:MAG: acetylglutamate kinase [Omnitrophica WOR_2 bacterium GWA2_45_18]OGX20711.1 MAG: acetylglutamate kinase [Omnitrophica WOR_2 bacterium GWC2_45_7]HBR15446.1 acetylglutamate kinase [Candidatus Omnitrophota bacterium]
MENEIKKASVLIEAIPYIHAFRRKVFVIKYGGSILENDTIRKNVLEDIVFLSYVGIRTILVHGGGPHISNRLKESGLKSEFHEGIRITDKETLKIVSEELEKLNKRIVQEIRDLKGDVTGLKGDENIVHVEKRIAAKDLGFVGSITSIDKLALDTHLKRGYITVISPMGISVEKQPHNINADEVASAIATSLEAEKLVLLTNVQGVMRNPEDPGSLISTLTVDEIANLIKLNVIQSGMIPKVNSCIEALNGGVKKTHIIDARIPHALLLEFFTNTGIGTQILNA